MKLLFDNGTVRVFGDTENADKVHINNADVHLSIEPGSLLRFSNIPGCKFFALDVSAAGVIVIDTDLSGFFISWSMMFFTELAGDLSVDNPPITLREWINMCGK